MAEVTANLLVNSPFWRDFRPIHGPTSTKESPKELRGRYFTFGASGGVELR